MNKSRGFTLVELMITLVVAGIVIGIAIPNFRDLIQSNRATTQANNVVTALNLARSEAVKRGEAVTICPTTDQSSCESQTDWSVGWLVHDAGDNVLRVWDGLGGGGTLDGPDGGFSYEALGDTDLGGTATFTLELDDCSGDDARTIEVNSVGRAAVERTAC